MTEEEFMLENRRWTNRRRMAWLSFWTMVVLTVSAVWFDRPVIEAAFYAFASIVGAYMGLATWYEKKK